MIWHKQLIFFFTQALNVIGDNLYFKELIQNRLSFGNSEETDTSVQRNIKKQ